MKITVTLDPDVRAQLKAVAHERNVSFMEVLNSTLRAGLATQTPKATPFKVKARPLGARQAMDLSQALRIADELDDEAVAHRLQLEE